MRYGVVPAGGLGTRSQLPHSKELAVVAGRPVIEQIFDRLVLAGIDRIFVTTHADKTDLNTYLSDTSPHRSILTLQIGDRLGLLDGIISPARALAPADELYFGLPDTVWYPPTGFAQLATLSSNLVLGLLPSATPELFGSVNIVGRRVVKITEKPSHPTSPWIWAFGKFTVEIVPELLALASANPVFTNVLGAYARSYPVPVVTFPQGHYFDTGTPAGLSAANKYVKK